MHDSEPVAGRLERIRFLLSLATDKGAAEEEARTAAMQAARLIVKHKIDLVEPYAPPPPPTPTRRGPPEHPEGRVIASKYASRCRICRAAVDVGDQVYWVPGRGMAHFNCWQNSDSNNS